MALMAGRERAICFVIVRKERTMRRKCCPKCGASTTSRARRTARRGSGTEIMFGKHEAIGAGCHRSLQGLKKMTANLRFDVSRVTDPSFARNLAVINAGHENDRSCANPAAQSSARNAARALHRQKCALAGQAAPR